MADLFEPRVLEDLTGANVDLAPGDLLACVGDHRVGLERPSAALAGEVDSCRGERIHQASAAIALADREAGHRPDAVVILVLVPAAPWNAGGAEFGVRGPWLDRDPAHRLTVEIGHQPTGGGRIRVTAGGLRPEHRGPLCQR